METKKAASSGGLFATIAILVGDSGALRWSRHGIRYRGGGFVQDAVVDGEQCQFQPVGNADLVVDVAEVVLDDLFGRTKLSGDFLVLITLDDERYDAEFLGGQ